MRIAIIVDGLESTRQINADGGEFLRAACELVAWGKAKVRAEIFGDRQVDALLSSIDVADYASIVFASNSLRHPGSEVVATVRRHESEINDFVASGGSLVVLHQFVEGTFPLTLPDGLDVSFRPRTPGTFQPVLFVDDNDSMCRLPHDLRTVSLLSDQDNRIAADGYWMALDEQRLRGFEVRARASNGDAVLAFGSVGNGGRVIICSAPLDWHAQPEAIVNVVQFATTGTPDFVIWESLSRSTSTFVAALRNLPEAWEVPLEDGSEETSAWLKNLGATHVMSEEQLRGSTTDTDSPPPVVPTNAQALSVLTLPDSSVRITSASFSQSHTFASRFLANLRSEPELWPRALEPFPTRNVVVAAEYFRQRHTDPIFDWDPRYDVTLRTNSPSLIFNGMTLTSSSAVAQTLAVIDRTNDRLEALIVHNERSSGGSPDEQILMSAFRTLCGTQSVEDFLMSGVLPHADTMSSAAALRALDWIAYFHFSRRLVVDPTAAMRVGEILIVKASSTEQRGLWESVEGTASGVLGAAALFAVSNEFAFLRSVSSPLVRLRTEYEIGVADNRTLSVMARMAHALAAAEDSGPLGIDVFTERSPRRLWSVDNGQERRARQSEQLVARFSESNRQLQEDLAKAKQVERDDYWVRITGAAFCWLVLIGTIALGLTGILVVARSSDIAGVWLVPLTLGAVTALHFALRVFESWRILPQRFVAINRSLEQPIRRRLGLN